MDFAGADMGSERRQSSCAALRAGEAEERSKPAAAARQDAGYECWLLSLSPRSQIFNPAASDMDEPS